MTRWSRHGALHILRVAVVILLVYVLLAYILTPAILRHYEHQPELAGAPKTTFNAIGVHGDPLNVALVGLKTEILRAFGAAGWKAADAITVRTSIEIGLSVLLHRVDQTAPVSNLFLYGRKQDLAFELLVGGSARQRHHVRFWQSPHTGADGRPLWLGAATFDHGVGISHVTGQLTHHIAPDIDRERNQVIAGLQGAGQLQQKYQVTGVGATLNGHNGEGDWYYTDGEMTVGVLSIDNATQTTPPQKLANPLPVRAKNRIWRWLRAVVLPPIAHVRLAKVAPASQGVTAAPHAAQ